jgi:acyl-CoA carboxylase epsilon subunit
VSGDATGEPTPEERRALFRVVRGEPTDAELAALTVVLAGKIAGAVAAAPRPEVQPAVRTAWNDPAARLRRPLTVGPGAWRASTWPR